MIRTVLVVIHAGTGIAGLVTGIPLFALPRGGDGRSWARWLYLACIAIMFVTLIALVVLDWKDLDTTARVAFTALNLPMPQVTVPVIAAAVLLTGQTLVGRYKRRVLSAR